MNNFPKINDCIDIDVLQEIQDRFSEATGLAVVTVDYMGRPITRYSNFSKFCTLLRKIEKCNEACFRSDAHGGIEAARSGKPCVYECHAGLIDFAIPIIIREQYLGAVLAGQVKIEEENKAFLDVVSVTSSSDWKEKKDDALATAYDEIEVIPYKKFVAAADMMFVISNYIVEKGLVHLVQAELSKKNLELVKEIKVRAELEKSLKDSEIKSLQSQMNPHFLFNVLNTISRLALLENAVNTQEIVFSFAELLRYTLKKNSTHLVYFKDEIQYIENYLKIQSMRLCDRLKYKIEIEEELKNVMIPFMILQPIVENAINHGIEKKKDGGSIEIVGYKLNDKVVIKIKDDGVGISKEELNMLLYENKKHRKDTFSTGIGLNNINKRLGYYFGETYVLDVNSRLNHGTTVKIQIPLNTELGDLNV
ncbi:sensor histidine kinase [Marinisporobacter balticus]|uniref:histidine kinase n=1 Tax=Marinisporobacter balticus TaxID=2018667 RepID=A0A4V2SC44_9FIRM|nr:PocR ligand-binding domain-containing protein [Marinisporobacter balticus]TCO77970.1 histidine kinase/DNA gyrase B/HSP90-like ATPase [Marinisporobacter balticus]